MANKIDLSQAPYFDDYNEDKKFYRILFRPSRAVQVREVNQLQSLLQKQIERMGAHIFEQGAQVLPGSKEGVKYVNNNGWIKIPRTANADDATQLETYWNGKIIVSTGIGASGIRARVIGYRAPDSIDEARLYLNYLNADTVNGESLAFVAGQNIQTEESIPVTATIVPTNASGTISSVIVEEGVYFFNGNFILVDQQTVFLIPEDPEVQTDWNNRPTCIAGLLITESVVSSDDDPSILDNTLGNPNYSAPGADRLRISADLVQRTLNDSETQFIPVIKVIDGTVQSRVVRTEYSVLEDTLARRTFDESGDYTVRPFNLLVRDFLRESENEGVHLLQEFLFDTEAEAEAAGLKYFGLATASVYPFDNSKYIPGADYDTFLSQCRSKLSLRIDPGKAYVKGYEIEKIATNVVDIDRARTLNFVNNKTINTPLGTYVYVTRLFGAPHFEVYDTVEIHDKVIASDGVTPNSKIGTAKVLSIEFFTGTAGASDALYRLFIFDVQADEGKDLVQMKSIYASGLSTFTCNIFQDTYRLTGSVASDTNKLIGTGTSWKNDATQLLKSGDYVQVGNGAQAAVYRVTADPVNDNELAVSPDPAGSHTWLDGSTIDYQFALIEGFTESPSLLYPLPDETVYTLRDENFVNIDQDFICRRVLGGGSVTANGSGTVTANLVASGEEFVTYSPLDYVVIDLADGQWMNVLPYTAGTPGSGNAEVQPVGTTLTVYTDSSRAGHNFFILASIRRTGNVAAKERSKILQKGSFLSNVYSGPRVVTTGSDIFEISLGKADILRVTRIVESPDFSAVPSNLKVLPAGHKDVTINFSLDNGQTDYFYGIGKVTLKPGAPKPKGRIAIEFDYFTHGNTGNYFSVDSYPFKGVGANMTYEEIPMYLSSENGGAIDLANYIDFRPRLNDNGVGFSNYLEVPRDNFRADYHYYQNRIDKLYLDRSGLFLVRKGLPDDAPVPPADPDTGMTIYQLYIRAYTSSPEECVTKQIDNRRYTMRDIGKLENRIKNLEYYTSLNLLEKQTNELLIPDASGNNKFKNGFIVDNFGTYKVSDPSNLDFRCSIDTRNRELRPITYQDNCTLSEKHLLETNLVLREQKRAADHYQKTGDLYTLPYTKTVMVEQRKCSKVSNINPYAVFTFVGSVKITPWSDEWRDTNQIEPLNILEDSQFQAISQQYGDGITQYGDPINNWTGIDISEQKTGVSKTLFAGHEDVDEYTKDLLEEKDAKNPPTPGSGNQGHKGASAQKGPGKKVQNAESKAGRPVAGGQRGGRNKKK